MKYKRIMLIGLLFLAILMIGAVSASDENKTSGELTVSEDSIVESFDDEVLSTGEGTFTDLSSLIESASEGDVLELDKDYQNNGSVSSEGITVSKSMTIDGKGHTLDADGRSRIFNINVVNVTLKNIVFKNGYNGDCGGAIQFSGSGTVEYCNFIDNSAGWGGAIHMYSGTVENCNFINNSVTSYGGAVYFYKGDITNCNFTSNTAEGDGGAVYFDEQGNVTNCYFVNNSVYYGGGAIRFSGTGNVTNCNFVDNDADHGGAILIERGNVTNCNFINNSAGWGGAIYFNEWGSLTNCHFVNNTASSGGAILIERGNVTNCNFTNNSAGDRGGAIYFNEDGSVTNCNFADNSAINGDSIYFGVDGKLENSYFKESEDTVYGGTIINCTFNVVSVKSFSDLSALIESTSQNGVLELGDDYLNDGSVSGEGIIITKALTIDGKGHTLDANGKSRIFRLSADDIVLKNITFINGYFTGNGGAVYNTGNCRIMSCSFINCSSGDCGGAIDNGDGVSNITSCIFTNCTATDGGGGVYNQEGSHYMALCSFVNCSCNNYGGAIGNGGSGNRYITACSFVNCSSSNYGGAIDNCADCNIISSSFDNCSANYGGAIFVNYIGVCDEISSCNFTDCSASNSGGAIYTRGDCNMISSCSFVSCSASEYGGAICWEDDDGTVKDSYFENNHAPGGADIYAIGVLIQQNNTFSAPMDNTTDANATDINSISNVTNATDVIGNVTDVSGNGTSANATVTPDITIPPRDNPADDGTVEITLPGDATGTVTLSINGRDYVFAVVDGKAIIVLPRLGDGEYNYTITYSGDSKYSSFTTSGILNVNDTGAPKGEADMYEAIPETVTTNDDGVLNMSVPEDANGTMTVYVDGEIYQEINFAEMTLTTFRDGVKESVVNISGEIVNVDLSGFEGKHTVTFEYSGDAYRSAFTKELNATIISNVAIKALNTSVTYGTESDYTITVFGSDGNPADGVDVIVTLNGNAISPLKTDAKGIAGFKVTQKPGTYKLSVTALGKTVNATLTVKHLLKLKKVSVKRSAKKLVLTATLGKVNGKYLKKKTVTFKFNGKKYKAKTDKKGVAKVTVKSSALKKLKTGKSVTYQATYKKDAVKKTVKVKK